MTSLWLDHTSTIETDQFIPGAAYAEVDATLVHPLDPVTTGGTVAELLRTHAPA